MQHTSPKDASNTQDIEATDTHARLSFFLTIHITEPIQEQTST